MTCLTNLLSYDSLPTRDVMRSMPCPPAIHETRLQEVLELCCIQLYQVQVYVIEVAR